MTSAEMVVVGMKHIVCFSGGHSSAIAAVEVVRKFGAEDAILLNHDLCPRTEDADIKRFKKQVSDYLGVPITYANMPGWDVKDQFDVCMEIKAFKAGAQSTAFCTNRLKTEPFHKWLSEHYPANPPEVRDDISLVYGFDANEQHRIRRRVGIMAAMGYQTEYPLTWEVRTIHDIEEVGIERPKTYSIFNHANCTGCLKAGKQHWFVVYCLYPKIWEKAKLAEDTIGYSILKQGYLSDFEAEFAKLKEKALPPTEKAKPQTFWAAARKLIRDDDDLPYSLKGEVFERLFQLNIPFAMLVGVVGLFESQKRFKMFREHDFEIMYLNRRVSYFKNYADQKPSLNPPFSSVYVCKGMLPKQIIFEEIQKTS